MAKPRTMPAVAPTTPLNVAAQFGRKELNDLVEVCLAAPMDGYPGHDDCLWGLPLLIEGLPGAAKTARVKQMSKVLRVTAKSLFAAQHPPEDFSGALIPDGKGGAKQICPLAQIRALIKIGRGIIFLDEVNGAPPATQGALQSFIHERVAGDEVIPGTIRIIAAANPEDIATGGFRFSAPLANRFLHRYDPGPTNHEWCLHQMGNVLGDLSDSLETLEQLIIAEWPNKWPETVALFTSFMETAAFDADGKSLLHKLPPSSDPQSGKAWPSHRTWEFAMRAWTTSNILDKGEQVRDALVECCVGEGAAAVFLTYARNTDIPAPLDVLSGKWRLNPDRLDIVLAAYNGATAYVRQRPDRQEKLKLAPQMWKALQRLFDSKLADVVIPCVEGMVAERLAMNSQDKATKEAAQPILVNLSRNGMQKYLEEQA